MRSPTAKFPMFKPGSALQYGLGLCDQENLLHTSILPPLSAIDFDEYVMDILSE